LLRPSNGWVLYAYFLVLLTPESQSTKISFPRCGIQGTRRSINQQSQHYHTTITLQSTATYCPYIHTRIMGLQRTPPPGKATSTRDNEAGPSNQAGNTSLPSPSQAFAPRNPRVMRSPQSGSTHASSSTSTRPAAPPVPATPAPPNFLAPIDEGNVSTTPLTAPPAPAPVPTPAHVSAPEPIMQQPIEEIEDADMADATEPMQAEAPTIPAPKRRKSRHHSEAPPQIAHEARHEPTGAAPIQTQAGIDGDYGPRHQAMLKTLEMAVEGSSRKMRLVHCPVRNEMITDDVV